jgi:hypothetical protein
MVWAQDAQSGGQHCAEFSFGLRAATSFSHHSGELVPGGKRVGVILAQNA